MWKNNWSLGCGLNWGVLKNLDSPFVYIENAYTFKEILIANVWHSENLVGIPDTLKNHQTQVRYYIYSFPKVEHNRRYCMSDANHGSWICTKAHRLNGSFAQNTFSRQPDY